MDRIVGRRGNRLQLWQRLNRILNIIIVQRLIGKLK